MHDYLQDIIFRRCKNIQKLQKIIPNQHSVWKWQKKCHLTLRAKRATFTFWVHKKSLKMPKNNQFCDFLKNKVCGQRVLPDRSVLIGQGKCQSWKFQMRQFSRFPYNFGVKIQTDIFSIFYPKTLRNINIPNKFLFYWAINWMDFVRRPVAKLH